MKNSVAMVAGKITGPIQKVDGLVRFSVQTKTTGPIYIRGQSRVLNLSSPDEGKPIVVFGYLESVYSRRCNSPHAYLRATNVMLPEELDDSDNTATALIGGQLHGYSRRVPGEGRFGLQNTDGLFFGRVYGEEPVGIGQLFRRGDTVGILGHLESRVSQVCGYHHVYVRATSMTRTSSYEDLWDEVGIPFLLWATHLIERQDDPAVATWWGGWENAATAFLVHQLYKTMGTMIK